MSCISYNCRGIGSDTTVRERHELVKRFKPTMLCVLETQVHRSRVEGLARRLGFDNSFVVSSDGRSRGLGVFWNKEIKLHFVAVFAISH
jgi:hypothetical protein